MTPAARAVGSAIAPVVRALGLAIAVVALVACQRVEIDPSPAAREPEPQVVAGPNLVLVTIDTLRADHVGAYGAAQAVTPTLDALAASGARFETALAVAPLTLPSHASILTGLYPPRHGVRHNGIFRLAPETPTLARALDDAGYQTGAFVGAAVLAREFGLSAGFDHYDDAMPTDRASSTGFPERRAEEVTDAALAWLARVGTPYFLWVHYYDPHADYAPPEPWAARFPDAPYDGEIAYVDAELGRLLAAVRSRTDGEDTIVAVTSDHGEGFGAQGEADHSYLVYDAHLRVPLIVAGPGIPASHPKGVVSPTSLAPTLLGLAGLPPLPATDVPDLSGLLRGTQEGLGSPESADGWAYAESLAGRLDHGWSPLHAIRTRSHHYVRGPAPELYDVRSDPQEGNDLGSAQDATSRAALARAEAHLAAVLAHEQALAPVTLDPERRAQVEALGYVVPETIPTARPVHPRIALPFAEQTFEANAALLAGHPEVALARIEPVVSRFPDSFRAHDLAARATLQLGDLDAALRHAERGVALLPDRPSAWALLGAVLTKRGGTAQAVAAYQEALRLDPAEIEPHLGLMALQLPGDPVAAGRHDEALLGLAATRPDMLERAGALWDAAGDPVRALARYEQAAALPGASVTVHQRRAIHYAREGRLAEADAALQGLSAGELEPGLQIHLAIVHAARGGRARAAQLLEALLAHEPGHEGARQLLARLHREGLSDGS